MEQFSNNIESIEKPFEITKKLSEKVRLLENSLALRDQSGFNVLLDDTSRALLQGSLEQIDTLSLSEDMDPSEIEKAMNTIAESLYYLGQADRGTSVSDDLESLNLVSKCLNDIMQVLINFKISLENLEASKYDTALKLTSEITDTIIPDRLSFMGGYYRAIQEATTR